MPSSPVPALVATKGAELGLRSADANANGETGNYIGNAVSRVGLFGVTVHQLGPWSAGLITRFIGAYPLSQDGTLTTPDGASRRAAGIPGESELQAVGGCR